MNPKKRVYVCFEYDKDRTLKHLLIGQSRHAESLFEVFDHSLKEAAPEKDWLDYENLRFARLCIYLRAREPDDFAGYSILIYRLSQEDLELALATNLPAFTAAVEALSHARR